MDFGLNEIEKFIIKHRIPLIIVTACIFILGIILSAMMFILLGPPLLVGIFCLVSQIYVFVIIKKLNQALAIRNNQLQPEKALDATNQLIEAIGEKDFQNMAVLLNNRIAFLMDMGEFEKAENEIRMFWQRFENKKLLITTRIAIHTNMAAIALEKKNFKAYEEQFGIVCQNESEVKNKRMKRQIQHMIVSLQQHAEAVVANENSDFGDYVTRVWATNHYEPIRNQNLSDEQTPPYSYLVAYENLFIFTQNIGDTEKAKTYAQQIVNMANEQFYIYRRAKEYIENGNSSN